MFIKILIAVLIILFLVLFWSRRLQREKSIAEEAVRNLRLAEQKLEEKNVQLEKLSITDKLTGVYNRVKLDSALQDELNRSNRTNDTFSIIMIDIDFFKKINDTFGHQVGDVALVDFTKIFKKSVRKTDIVGRWGGEEFLIICPHTDSDGAMKKAEIMRVLIMQEKFETIGYQTVSLGVTTFKQGDTIESMVGRADSALYKAKNEGRNKTVLIREINDTGN